MKRLVEQLLRGLSRSILDMYEPTVVGITGSVGKTSTKDAVAAVLAARFAVRKNLKNYNNEFGVPLTIIGVETAGRSAIGWLGVKLKALRLLFVRDTNYPDVLVLELGADHPGDIQKLTDLVPCTVGVLTAVSPAHTEFFGSVDAVLAEKRVLIDRLPLSGTAVLNADDERVRAASSTTRARVLTYGFSDTADVRATEPALVAAAASSFPTGLQCMVRVGGSAVPLQLAGVVGRHQLVPALAAIAVGLSFGMNLAEAVRALGTYRPPAGRMGLVPGIKNTLILDDSYNSSPAALHAALDTLRDLPNASRRIVCLGTMAELGALSDEEHERAGRRVVEHGFDLLITVGAEGKKIARAAEAAGMSSDHIFAFDESGAAGRFLQERMETGDVILVKGSQMVRLERIVKEVMAEPERAGEVLVRQGKEWEK